MPSSYSFKALTFVAVFILSLPILAGERLEFTVKQSQVQETITILLQGDHARMNSSANTQTTVLFDASSRQLRILEHSKKQITRVDQSTINEWADIIQSVGAFAQAQGGVLGDIFQTFGLDNQMGEKAEIRTVKKASNKKFSGVNCQSLAIFKKDVLATELCVASKMNITAAEAKTLQALIEFMQVILQKGQLLLEQFGMAAPVMPKSPIQGVPVFINDKQKGITATLKSHQKQAISNTQFEIPAAYQEAKFGF